MSYIRDMHTYFPASVIQLTDRQSIVEVFCIFRVDGKGQDFTEVFTLGDLFLRNGIRYFICSLLHTLRISIRQTEFGQYRVHFCRVLTGHT